MPLCREARGDRNQASGGDAPLSGGERAQEPGIRSPWPAPSLIPGSCPLSPPGRAASPYIHSLNLSNGGVPKLPVAEARVTLAGLGGDWQKNRKYHGGPERALCLYALERIDALAAEGHGVAPGALGENITVAGLAWESVVPGVRLRLGQRVLVEVASFTKPCRTIAGFFADGRPVRVSQAHHPGWSRVYARVLDEGEVRRGDPIAVEGG